MPWVKGQSGNPGGRPEIPAKIRGLLRKSAPEALKEIVRLSTDAKEEKDRIKAGQVVLDRAWGKVVQAIEASGPDGGHLVIRWAKEGEDG